MKKMNGALVVCRRGVIKFFYNPLVVGNPAPYVFLDVVEEPHIPHDVVVKPITANIS